MRNTLYSEQQVKEILNLSAVIQLDKDLSHYLASFDELKEIAKEAGIEEDALRQAIDKSTVVHQAKPFLRSFWGLASEVSNKWSRPIQDKVAKLLPRRISVSHIQDLTLAWFSLVLSVGFLSSGPLAKYEIVNMDRTWSISDSCSIEEANLATPIYIVQQLDLCRAAIEGHSYFSDIQKSFDFTRLNQLRAGLEEIESTLPLELHVQIASKKVLADLDDQARWLIPQEITLTYLILDLIVFVWCIFLFLFCIGFAYAHIIN